MDSLTTLQSMQSSLYHQLKEINQNSPTISSPTISTDSPNNVNTVNELSPEIQNIECQFDNSSLYDPWDTKLEITFCNGFKRKYKNVELT